MEAFLFAPHQWVEPEHGARITWERPSNLGYCSRGANELVAWEPLAEESADQEGDSAEINRVVGESRQLLDLEDNWDGEGASGYLKETLTRATDFLIKQWRRLWESERRNLPPPRIGPGPDGSIDLHWKGDGYELLVNIPRDGGTPASFYGDDHGSLYIEGTLDTSTYNQGLLTWLSQHV